MLKNTTANDVQTGAVNSGQSEKRNYSPVAIRRIVSELESFHKTPPYGIFIHSDEEDIGRHTVLIIGPEGTPYEDGFFFFEMLFPEDYPFSPPKVEIRTTNPEYRFNPNFYLEGKVCLSILGTWQGPSWEPTMSIDTTLISIQARMNEWPLENEPGYETIGKKQKLEYNHIVRELTLRYSVLGQLTNGFPKTRINTAMSFESFRPIMTEHFLKKHQNYLRLIDTLPNIVLSSRFGGYSRKPDLAKLQKDLVDLSNDLLSTNAIAIPNSLDVTTNSTSSSINYDNSTSSTSTSEVKEEATFKNKGPRLKIIVPRGRPVKVTT